MGYRRARRSRRPGSAARSLARRAVSPAEVLAKQRHVSIRDAIAGFYPPAKP